MGLLLQPLTVGAEYLRAVFHCIREREQRALAIVLSLCHFSPAGAWFHRGEMLEANALGHCLQSIVERTLVSILEAALSTNCHHRSRRDPSPPVSPVPRDPPGPVCMSG